MELRKYTITWEPPRNGYKYSAEEVAIANEANKLASNGGNYTSAYKNKLKKARAKFPDNPSLNNYLAIALKDEGYEEELYELIEETLLKHPSYFFGKSMKAEVLLEAEKLKEAAELMKGFKDIGLLYPDRTEFHFSEIRAFYAVAVKYHLLNNDQKSAIKALKELDKFGIDIDEINVIAETAERLKMRVRIKNISKVFESKHKGKNGSQRKSKLPQTQEPATFNHVIVNELYHNGVDISFDLLNRILAMPRETLIEDLQNVVLDGIRMYDHFSGGYKEFDAELMTFPIHAMLLLGELKATESLQTILELCRQEIKLFDYWFGDIYMEVFERVLFQIAANDLNAVIAYVKEPENDHTMRFCIANFLKTIVVHYPERRDEVVDNYKNLLDFIWDNQKDDAIFDSTLLGFIGLDISKIKKFDLLESHMLRFFERDLVNETIAGNFEQHLENKKWDDKLIPIEPHPLELYYEKIATMDWQSLTEVNYGDNRFDDENYFLSDKSLFEKAFDDDFIKSKKAVSTPKLADKKIGRNDLCFCGSGKKYKKCHG